MPQPSTPAESGSTAIITPRGLLGAVLFGCGLVVVAALPVGLVLLALGNGTLVLIIAAIAFLPGLAIMALGGLLMYRSLRPAPSSSASDSTLPDNVTPGSTLPGLSATSTHIEES